MEDKDKCNKTPHDELCNNALTHYEEIASVTMHHNSLVPKAIEFYRDNLEIVKENLIFRKALRHACDNMALHNKDNFYESPRHCTGITEWEPEELKAIAREQLAEETRKWDQDKIKSENAHHAMTGEHEDDKSVWLDSDT